MKVKSESEVAQSCPTLLDPMDCSLPGSSVHGIFQSRVLEWGAIAFSVLHALLGPKYPNDANWMTRGLLILHINETRIMLWTFSVPLIRTRKIRPPFYAANDTY